MAQEGNPAGMFTNASNFSVNGSNFYSASGNINLNNTYIVSNQSEIEELQKLTLWLTKINFRTIQNDTFVKIAPGTGVWFIQCAEFERWQFSAGQKTLWVTGIPGAGKTVLSSIAIHHLEEYRSSNPDIAVLFAYCRYSDHCSVVDILLSFVRQLLESYSFLHAPIKTFCLDHQRKGTRPSKNDLLILLKKLLVSFRKVFTSIDALDEVADDTKYDILQSVGSLPPNTSVLLTSRPVNCIAYLLPHAEHVSMENGTAQDIETFIMVKIEQTPRLRSILKKNAALIKEVCDKIQEKSQGMFLVAALHIESLQRTTTLKNLRKSLELLPSGVEDSYRSTWQRILSQSEEEAEQAKLAISWLTYAKRTLTITELVNALAVSQEDEAFDEDDILDPDLLLSVCCGLITVEEQSSHVRLVHYTAHDFFRAMGEELNPNPHALITRTSLAYLSNFDFPNNIEPATGHISKRQELVNFIKHQPFLDYAYYFWGQHAQAGLEEDEELSEKIEGFLTVCDQHYPWIFEDQDEVYNSFDLFHMPHVLASFGLSAFLPCILEHRHAKTLLTARSPLHLSALYGHVDFVNELLKQEDVDVNVEDKRGQTALMLASKEQAEVVKVLLASTNIDINKQDARGLTSFLRACQVGNREIVELHFTNPEVVRVLRKAAGDGRTPLCEAVRCGQKETVELLLSQEGVDVNQRDRGDTALIRACIKGYPGIVEVLLAQPEIQVNKQDERGSTALHHVANGKHETILAMLLARTDLDVNIDNDHGNTPLTLASYRGHTNIVRGLLARSDILVNKPEPKRQETALHMAASRGDLECVALLAGAAGVDINARDIRGYTPYHVAMSAGQNMVVEFLSELPGIDLTEPPPISPPVSPRSPVSPRGSTRRVRRMARSNS